MVFFWHTIQQLCILLKIVNFGLDEIRQNSSRDVVIYLVGNQINLVITGMENREVTFEEGLEFAKKNNLGGFKETSARSGISV